MSDGQPANVDPRASAHARARELATMQCEPEEIVAVLEEELGWHDIVGHEGEGDAQVPVTRARRWAIDNAPEVTRARLVARTKLREEIWLIAVGTVDASKMSSQRRELLTELMRQHCGWAKQAPLDKLMDAYFAAQRDADRKARSGGSRRAA